MKFDDNKKVELSNIEILKKIILLKMYLNNNLNDKKNIYPKKETYIFVDISNIYVGFYNYIIHNYKKI